MLTGPRPAIVRRRAENSRPVQPASPGCRIKKACRQAHSMPGDGKAALPSSARRVREVKTSALCPCEKGRKRPFCTTSAGKHVPAAFAPTDRPDARRLPAACCALRIRSRRRRVPRRPQADRRYRHPAGRRDSAPPPLPGRAPSAECCGCPAHPAGAWRKRRDRSGRRARVPCRSGRAGCAGVRQ